MTDDPSRETSPTLKIYHATPGESFFGEGGMGHQRVEYGGWERAWDGFIGVTSIIGCVLPVLHGTKLVLVPQLHTHFIRQPSAMSIHGAGNPSTVETFLEFSEVVTTRPGFVP